MSQIQNKRDRILGISLSTYGFGYAALQGDGTLVDYGKAVIKKDRNARSLAHVKKIIARNLPDAIVLQDMSAKGTYRVPRINKLHDQVVALAKTRNIQVITISRLELRRVLLNNENGTKHQMAELLAKQFPDELAPRLPPKRTASKNADPRMDIFDAAGMAVAMLVSNQP